MTYIKPAHTEFLHPSLCSDAAEPPFSVLTRDDWFIIGRITIVSNVKANQSCSVVAYIVLSDYYFFDNT